MYISGPMSGIPLHNFPAFEVAASTLRAQGHIVVSPHELEPVDHAAPKTWEYYIRQDIKHLMECDHLVLLPSWRESRGAMLEYHIAVVLGFRLSEFVNGELR